MNTQSSKTGREHLTLVQSARLIGLLELDYVVKNLTDDEFAAYATEKLGFSVNIHQIKNRRAELGILSSVDRKQASKKLTQEALFELITKLEQRVDLLEKKMSPTGFSKF